MIDDSQLADQILSEHLTDEDSLREGIRLAQESENTLYETLIGHGLVDERQLVVMVSNIINVANVDLSSFAIDSDTAHLVPASIAMRNRSLPLEIKVVEGVRELLLAMADPIDMFAMDEIASHTGVNIRPILAGPADLARAMKRIYELETESKVDLDVFAELEELPAAEFGDAAGGVGTEDSWAVFFDQAADDPPSLHEDSVQISQDMRDRPPTDVFEVVHSDLMDLNSDSSGVESLSMELSMEQLGGGQEMNLDGWEIDLAIEDHEAHKDGPAPVLPNSNRTSQGLAFQAGIDEQSIVDDDAPYELIEVAGPAEDDQQPEPEAAEETPEPEVAATSTSAPLPVPGALGRIKVKRIAVPLPRLREKEKAEKEKEVVVEQEPTTREFSAVDLIALSKQEDSPDESEKATKKDKKRVSTPLGARAVELRSTAKVEAVTRLQAQEQTLAADEVEFPEDVTAQELLHGALRALIAKGTLTLEEILAHCSKE